MLRRFPRDGNSTVRDSDGSSRETDIGKEGQGSTVGSVLEVQDVSLELNHRVIFRDLSFALREKEHCLILGGSGSGKTLFLKLCAGLIPPDLGRVTVSGVDLATASKEDLQELRLTMGFVFQDCALISNMAIFDNVALPLRYHRGWSEDQVRTKVEEMMTLFGVDRNDDRSIPAQLSLGMRKRVALARALVLEPRLLFLDQATDGLGSQSEQEVSRILREYQTRIGASFLAVTDEAPSFLPPADRVGVLRGGQIVADGTLQEMRSHGKNNPKAAGQC